MQPLYVVVLLCLLAAAVPAVKAQLTYNQQFMLYNANNGHYCAVDLDGSGNPLRCDYLVGGATLFTLTGNNSPIILNSSYIVNNSLNAILNAGIGHWCVSTVKTAYDTNYDVFCSYYTNLPYFQVRKRLDLGGVGGPYLWSGDHINIYNTNRASYCGVTSSIMHCDFATPTNGTAFRVIY
jgi:hypothetical protein